MILVTGGTGFIGSYVLRELLARGHGVVATSRYDWRPESSRILGADPPELLRPDLREPDEVIAALAGRPIEGIVHLDAVVDPVALATDPLRALDANLRPTIGVLEACRALGIGRFVLASSVAVLPEIRHEPIRADHPLVTESGGPAGGFYGVAKAASEVVALGYASAFGIDVRVVRPSAVYGFGMRWPIGIKPVLEGLVDGLPVTMSGRAPPRDYTPVQDVAAVFGAILDAGPDVDVVVNAGTGRELTTADGLVRAMRSVFPAGDIRISDEDLDPLGIESRYRGVLDMSAARDQLGLRPTFDSLEDGLAAYAEAYRRGRRDAG